MVPYDELYNPSETSKICKFNCQPLQYFSVKADAGQGLYNV